MLRRLITAAALAAVPLLGVTVPAVASTPPAPCPGGYAPWYITDGSHNYYLTSNGSGNPVTVSTNQVCWHAPGTLGTSGTFKNVSGLCLTFDAGEVTVIGCNGAQSQLWNPTTGIVSGSVLFANVWAENHQDAIYLNSGFGYGDDVGLASSQIITANDSWHG